MQPREIPRESLRAEQWRGVAARTRNRVAVGSQLRMHGGAGAVEKKEPLTRAIILGRTRLELQAANSAVSWHSLARDAGMRARDGRDVTVRGETNDKDSHYRY